MPIAFIKPELLDLVPAYLERRAAEVVLLKSSIESRDFDSIRKIGHKLRGNGGTFGFDWLSVTGEKLEAAAQGEDLPGVRMLTQELSDYLAHLEIRPKDSHENI